MTLKRRAYHPINLSWKEIDPLQSDFFSCNTRTVSQFYDAQNVNDCKSSLSEYTFCLSRHWISLWRELIYCAIVTSSFYSIDSAATYVTGETRYVYNKIYLWKCMKSVVVCWLTVVVIGVAWVDGPSGSWKGHPPDFNWLWERVSKEAFRSPFRIDWCLTKSSQ